MKTKSCFAIIALLATCFACTNVEPLSEIERLATTALSTTKFRSLNIGSDLLNIENTIRTDRNLLMIPFKNDIYHMVGIELNKNNEVTLAFDIIAIYDQKNSGSSLEQLVRDKKFTGQLVFTTSENEVLKFDFVNSIIAEPSVLRKLAQLPVGRAAECGYWACDGCNNVFSCAGRKFSRKDWVEIVFWCSWGFFGCLSNDIYTCYRDACPRDYR